MIMFSAARNLTEAGVLGMNRRNADYIMACNPRSAFPLVDDKVLTKGLAEKYQVPTPRVYHVIEHQGDIIQFEKKFAQYGEFALKPARGAGGSGIVLIKEHQAKKFVKPSGEEISWEDLSFHISNILSGIYSLGGLPDRAIIESLIHPDATFAAISYRGVPDIRIIVYRGVPVMGMVRLPTKTSDGKANLHRGAIGAGIDIARGRTLLAVHRSRVITHHPDTGSSVTGIEIPYWKPMLLVAARAMDMTGLGYLGVDLVVDRIQGPLLLELNARPGLAIQLANQSGLLKRLNAIDYASPDIFASPQARIAWAMETFKTLDS